MTPLLFLDSTPWSCCTDYSITINNLILLTRGLIFSRTLISFFSQDNSTDMLCTHNIYIWNLFQPFVDKLLNSLKQALKCPKSHLCTYTHTYCFFIISWVYTMYCFFRQTPPSSHSIFCKWFSANIILFPVYIYVVFDPPPTSLPCTP